jgi:hypothetical protein
MIMAVATRTVEHLARPRRAAGGPSAPSRQGVWERLIGAIDSLNRAAQLIVEVERVGPYKSVDVARRWLERQ